MKYEEDKRELRLGARAGETPLLAVRKKEEK